MPKASDEEWDYQWDTTDVAAYLEVKYESVTRMRSRNPHFMPEPDGRIGNSPWWWSGTIKRWDKNRPGRGAPKGGWSK